MSTNPPDPAGGTASTGVPTVGPAQPGHPLRPAGPPATHPTFPGVQLQPWSFWDQMNDPAMDGDRGQAQGTAPYSGPNAPSDCGPESAAMCLAHLTAVQLDADYIWDCIQQLRVQHGQPTGPGYTSIQDLQMFLREICSIDTQLLQVDAAKPFADPAVQAFLHRIRNALAQGHPLIGLFSFTAPNADDGHFRAIIGDTGHYLLTADPAKGYIPPHGPRVEGYRVFWSWSKGFALELKRKRAIVM